MTRVSQLAVKRLTAHHAEEGSLIAIEGMGTVPFKIKRVFYVYGVKNHEPRGNHAHRECTQVLICLNGTCEVICDDSMEKRAFQLKDPSEMLLIPPGIWAEERYLTGNTVLMVLCDQHYDDADYIKEPEEFRAYKQGAFQSPGAIR